MSDGTVAVLGSGPAGLMAAHACAMLGLEAAIFSVGGPSQLGGAQFLHRPIPGITDEPDGKVVYNIVGDAPTYQAKAYGDGPQPAFVSFSNVENGQVVDAWNLRDVYSKLVGLYHSQVNEVRVDSEWMTQNLKNFQLVISTIPLNALCRNRRVQPVYDGSDSIDAHVFHSKTVRILNGRAFVPEGVVRNFGENVVIYNGRRDYTWYRSSDLWGVKSTEFGAIAVPYQGLVTAVKPVSTNCTCYADAENVLLAGRYGAWDKSRLTHDGFYRTLAHFSATEGGGSIEEAEAL